MSHYIIKLDGDAYVCATGSGWMTRDKSHARKYKTKTGAKIGLSKSRHFRGVLSATIEEGQSQ